MNIGGDMRSCSLAVFKSSLVRPIDVIALFALSSAASYSANAQNSTVIGEGSFATDCARASSVAITTGSASRQDLLMCDRAILEGNLGPKDLVASYVNRGVIHMAMGKPKLALADINRALAKDSETGEAYVNRGNLWFLGKRLEDAIQDYDKAIDLGVERPHVAHLNRAMAYEQLGNLDKAKLDYQTALQYRNDWSEAQTRLDRVEKKLLSESREDK